jgi:hypothetical protein
MAADGGRRNRGTNAWSSICPLERTPLTRPASHPEQKILAVNGQVFSGDLFRAAIRDAKGKTEPIHLILQSDTFVSNVDIDYYDGERYPLLERVVGTPPISTTSPSRLLHENRHPLRRSRATYCCCAWISSRGEAGCGGSCAFSTITDQSSGVGRSRSSAGGSSKTPTFTAT